MVQTWNASGQGCVHVMVSIVTYCDDWEEDCLGGMLAAMSSSCSELRVRHQRDAVIIDGVQCCCLLASLRPLSHPDAFSDPRPATCTRAPGEPHWLHCSCLLAAQLMRRVHRTTLHLRVAQAHFQWRLRVWWRGAGRTTSGCPLVKLLQP